jgi:hypothetical protein
MRIFSRLFPKKLESGFLNPTEQKEKEIIARWVETLKWNLNLIAACKRASSADQAYRQAEPFLVEKYYGTEICPVKLDHRRGSLLKKAAILAAGEIFLNLHSMETVKEKIAVPA